MSRAEENFVALLLATSLGVQAAYQKVIDEWSPDDPPVTIMFGALGDRIVDEFDTADIETKRQMFTLIETAMESGDIKLITSVGTGLIESMVGRAERSQGLWNRIASLLGPRSLYHAEAWLNWGSGEIESGIG